MKTAEEMYPYLPNEENDIAIREYNQLMYGRREAYNEGVKAMQSYAHPSPMSAEQVNELAEKYASEEFDKHSFSEFKGAENSLWENRKADFIAGYKAATTPSVKADGWVSVQEKQRLEQIIELKEKERQEWANMCIRNKKILDGLISGYCTVNEYMYNEYGKLILKEISETFLKNATKADRISDTEVFQALGETILNFPLPSPPTVNINSVE